jgi:triphosphoribosyl-dephospho-CoA synthetase
LLSKRISGLGFKPFDYQPLPAQTAMFNAIEGLTDTCQRMAGFSLAGEAVATYLTRKCLQSTTVPDWIKQPYRKIARDEEGHSSIPQEILQRYATTEERQEAARRAVAMRIILFREYLSSLDRWAMGKERW